VKVNFYLDVGELTSRTLANRPKTLANDRIPPGSD